MAKTILVVDDTESLRTLVKSYLTQEGFRVVTAVNGREALFIARQEKPDLILLDLMMPEMGGYEFMRVYSREAATPIILLTAKIDENDKVLGLELGADDYVTKPFTFDVLLARIRAVLRRSEPSTAGATESSVAYSDGYLSIDLSQRRILAGGNPIKLTATEHRLLAYFVENAGQVLTFKQILENVWGGEYRENTDYVHVYIWHLRKKLEKNPKVPQYILTEHGVGYRFEKAAVQSEVAALAELSLVSQAV